MAAPCPLFPKQQVESDNSVEVDGQDSFLAVPTMLLAIWLVYLMLPGKQPAAERRLLCACPTPLDVRPTRVLLSFHLFY